jgi:hypothetical protein
MPISSSVKRVVGPALLVASNSKNTKPAAIPKHWHAVSVDAKPLSCVVAHDARKKRYLSKEAPTLPLEGCTKRGNCPCTYKHHEDRRGNQRRKEGAGISSSAGKHGSERRSSGGRRADD